MIKAAANTTPNHSWIGFQVKCGAAETRKMTNIPPSINKLTLLIKLSPEAFAFFKFTDFPIAYFDQYGLS